MEPNMDVSDYSWLPVTTDTGALKDLLISSTFFKQITLNRLLSVTNLLDMRIRERCCFLW